MKSPQALLFLADCGGKAATVGQNITFLGGLQPSEPPAESEKGLPRKQQTKRREALSLHASESAELSLATSCSLHLILRGVCRQARDQAATLAIDRMLLACEHGRATLIGRPAIQ